MIKSSRSSSVVDGRFYFSILFLPVLAAILLMAPGAFAEVRFAAPTAAGSADCSSWTDVCTLQTAFSVAVAGDEIWVLMGVHKPTDTSDRTISFALTPGVLVYGGFAGGEMTLEQRDWEVNLTVLSGDIDGNDVTDPYGVVNDPADIVGANSFHVVTVGGAISGTAGLDGFVITAGKAESPENHGGGIKDYAGDPVLTNLLVIGNSAAGNGGGAFIEGAYGNGAAPTLSNVTFRNNSATTGGGMSNFYFVTPTLTDCAFEGNTAAADGGGMHNISDANPALTNVIFSANSAASGGGIFNNTWANPSLTNVTFEYNTAVIAGGGMASHDSAHPALDNVVVRGNSATSGGGLYYAWNANSYRFRGVTFIDNTAVDGGGVYCYRGASFEFANAVFFGNTATGNGGAICNRFYNLELDNVTMAGNTAAGMGGGIHNSENSNLTMSNSVLWNNSAPIGPEISYDSANPAYIDYCLIANSGGSGTGWNATLGVDNGGNIDADPLFVDAPGGDLHPSPTSPVIDAGNNGAVPVDLALDLDGNPRYADVPEIPDTGLGTPPIIDMGAYEVFPDVTVEKEVLPAVNQPGGPIVFTLTLTATGTATATGLVLTDTIAPSVVVTSVVADGITIVDTGAMPAFVWDVQDLAPGDGGTVTIFGVLVSPLAAGDYTNTASIEFAGMAAAPNHTAGVTYTVANVAPTFSSAPPTFVEIGDFYSYTATTDDLNGDAVTITAPTLPAWLDLTDHGNGSATVSGTPGAPDLGWHPVVLRVVDGGGAMSQQSFNVHVDTTPIFMDGFESGTTSVWSATVGGR